VNRNRVSFRQRLCGGVALRLAPAVTPPALHFFRSLTADRSGFQIIFFPLSGYFIGNQRAAARRLFNE
jgi:hypothetical protein